MRNAVPRLALLSLTVAIAIAGGFACASAGDSSPDGPSGHDAQTPGSSSDAATPTADAIASTTADATAL
ncbi:MAG TPA: hypothetical protein VFX50_04990, partial [Gemmatimonadales bacterium]|nr:hypothetical protein [Gemmatimonadales bacterium]